MSNLLVLVQTVGDLFVFGAAVAELATTVIKYLNDVPPVSDDQTEP